MAFKRVLLVVLLVASLLPGCTSPTSPTSDPRIEAMVSSAASPAEHRRIAAYYREQAAQARESAEAHRHLAALYGDRQNWGVAFTERARHHCEDLARRQDEAAQQYGFLATEHDRLAQK